MIIDPGEELLLISRLNTKILKGFQTGQPFRGHRRKIHPPLFDGPAQSQSGAYIVLEKIGHVQKDIERREGRAAGGVNATRGSGPDLFPLLQEELFLQIHISLAAPPAFVAD